MNGELKNFLQSKDFMRIGKCISYGQWQAAAMTISRMQNTLNNLDVHDFDRNLTSLRQCIIRKDINGSKNALAVVINKRVAMMQRQQ